MRASATRVLLLGAAVWSAAVFAAPAHAQQLALKRSIPMTDARPACPPGPRATGSRPSVSEIEQAARLVAEGTRASIVGDHAGARDLLARAARLDPTAENIAFHLARAHDELGETDAAVAEYCRYLGLAPSAADAADVRRRIDQLVPPPEPRVPPGAVEQFRLGLEAFDQNRLAAAELAFGQAIAAARDWAELYYNRAVVRRALGGRADAAADFERYLDLVRGAPDAGLVRGQIEQLRRTPRRLSSGAAVVSGLLVPGMGQFYTRRPVLGILALAGAGAGVAVALRTESSTERREYVDPFGIPYVEEVEVERRPNFAVGAGVAAAVLVAAAVEAGVYAGRTRRTPPSDTRRRGALNIESGSFRLAVPHFDPARDRIRVHLLRIDVGAR